MLRVAGLNEARRRLDAEPGEPRPILVPPIGEEAHAGTDDEILDPSEHMAIDASLGLLVERREQERAEGTVEDGEADRHQPRCASGRDRPQDRPPGPIEKRDVLRLQDRHVGSMAAVGHGSPVIGQSGLRLPEW